MFIPYFSDKITFWNVLSQVFPTSWRFVSTFLKNKDKFIKY